MDPDTVSASFDSCVRIDVTGVKIEFDSFTFELDKVKLRLVVTSIMFLI